VQRQYTGTAGRIDNAQVAVYLVDATSAGHALVDRALYLPRAWTDDPQRLQAAGVPDQVGFATKPALATAMLARALDAGIPAAWVAGDEVYGANPKLRAELEARQIGYVLAVACDHRVRIGGTTHRADALLTKVPAWAWQCVSAGRGAKGHRHYDWALLCLDHPSPGPGGQAGQHWLIRRNQRTSAALPAASATLSKRRRACTSGPTASSSGATPTARTFTSKWPGRPVRPGGGDGWPGLATTSPGWSGPSSFSACR